MFDFIDDVDVVKGALADKGVCMGCVKPTMYHAWKKELEPCISKSGLVDFMHDAYVYRWRELHGEGRKDTPAMRSGRLVDCLLLTPELFREVYAVEDINLRTKEGKARAAELAAAGREVVGEVEYAEACRAAVTARGGLMRLFDGEVLQTQVAIWARADALGLRTEVPLVVCGMLDLVARLDGRAQVVDVKSTSIDLMDYNAVKWNVRDFRYGLQAALYLDLYRLATGEDADFSLFYLSRSAPYRMRPVVLDDGLLEESRVAYRKGLVDFAHALASADWGDALLDPVVVSF